MSNIDFGLNGFPFQSIDYYGNDFDFDFLTQYLLFDDDDNNENNRIRIEGQILNNKY